MDLSKLPYWPAALRLDQAAAYCGLSVDTFKEVCTVAPIQFTQSSHGRRWLPALPVGSPLVLRDEIRLSPAYWH